MLAAIILAGAFLRLDGLAERSLSHTEAFVPNIEWPDGLTWPPTRTDFWETFWWHFHSEGHPQAYYFFMWGWTKVFGTSLESLRLPSALFGIGSIPLVFWIGWLTYGRRAGLAGAALVAFSGYHVFWSQYARMFMMASFLGLLSTLLLLLLMRRSGHSAPLAAGYVLVSWIGIYTQTFFWALLAGQMIWIVLQREESRALVARVLTLQAAVVAVSAAALAHVIYLGEDGGWAAPSLSFWAEYLNFGFLTQPDVLSQPARTIPLLISAAMLALALVLISLGATFRARTLVQAMPQTSAGIGAKVLLPIAFGSAMVVLGFVLVARQREVAMAFTAVVPFLALGIVPANRLWLDRCGRRGRLHGGEGRARRLWHRLHPAVALAFIPVLLIFLLSFATSMLAVRGFVLFVPYLLLVIGAGMSPVLQRRWLAVPVYALVPVVLLIGLMHFRGLPSDGRDYAAIAQLIESRSEPGDLIFVRPSNWVLTPMYFHLADDRFVFTSDGFDEAVGDSDARVWLVFFESVRWGWYPTTTDEMLEAVADLRLAETVEARRARAELYVRD